MDIGLSRTSVFNSNQVGSFWLVHTKFIGTGDPDKRTTGMPYYATVALFKPHFDFGVSAEFLSLGAGEPARGPTKELYDEVVSSEKKISAAAAKAYHRGFEATSQGHRWVDEIVDYLRREKKAVL